MNARAVARHVAAELAAAGVPDADFEAEYLVRTAAGLSRAAFFAGAALPCDRLEALREATARRAAREPAAYIAGTREFYGLPIAVAPGVLVPRPESELLVEAALEALADAPEAVVVDVGTGSGCIAAAVAANAPRARVVALDRSPEALCQAAANLRACGNAALARSDLATAVGRADVVVANLPYIPTAEIAGLEPEVRDWEPRSALDGGADGLDLIRRLVADCGTRLRPRLLALEVGAGQAAPAARSACAAGAAVEVRRDLAGIERVVLARWR